MLNLCTSKNFIAPPNDLFLNESYFCPQDAPKEEITLTPTFVMNSYSLTIIPASGSEEELKIDTLDIKKSAIILRAVNHKLRQVMLKFIGEKGQVTVTEIFEHLLLEQAVASQQLAILRKTGFVKTKREGKFIYYSVNRQRLLDLNRFVSDLLG
jgi:DNA-binding transcriptional ArsR family regulator